MSPAMKEHTAEVRTAKASAHGWSSPQRTGPGLLLSDGASGGRVLELSSDSPPQTSLAL